MNTVPVAAAAGGRRPPDAPRHWVIDSQRGLFAIAAPLGDSARSATFVLESIGDWPRPGADVRASIENSTCAALRELLLSAQARWSEIVRSDRSLRGTGATLAAVVLNGDEASVAHLGDCRVYQFRDGHLLRRTRDHTGRATQTPSGRARNVLFRAFGMDSNPEIRTWPTQPNDVFLLSSEVHKVLTDDEITAVLADGDAGRCVSTLVESTEERGATNWTTAVVVRLVPTVPG